MSQLLFWEGFLAQGRVMEAVTYVEIPDIWDLKEKSSTQNYKFDKTAGWIRINVIEGSKIQNIGKHFQRLVWNKSVQA